MRIDTSGRLGVGTSTFDDTREMIRIKNTGGDGTFLTIEAPNDSGSSEIFFADADFNRGRIAYEHSTDDMQFWVGDNERMRIDSSGNVGIGTTSPSQKVEIRQVNLTRFARVTKNKVGEKVYNRNFKYSENSLDCSKFSSVNAAQIFFLKNGGPNFDYYDLDKNGDGFACKWDPEIYRQIGSAIKSELDSNN